jgi:2-phospho-L-lactate guanylyltransferase
LPVAVVCDDPAVATWAREHGALVVWAPGRGLNGAVAAGVESLRAAGYERVVIAHGDLPLAPLASGLGAVDQGGVTLVPDLRRDGTNVLCIPTGAPYRLSYGRGSFGRHCAEAVRIGLALHVVDEPSLAFDVDMPDDLAALGALRGLAGR